METGRWLARFERLSTSLRVSHRSITALSLGLAGGASLSTRSYHDDLMDGRKQIWQQTVSLANNPSAGHVKPAITKKSIEGTKLYETREGQLWVKNSPDGTWKQVQVPQTGKSYETQFEVVDQDSFVVAKTLVEAGYRPLVLNMANKLSVGGGVEHGSAAQEECLFRASNYFQSLYPWGDRCTNGSRKGRVVYREQIPEFGSYYSPFVQVFRNGGLNYALTEPYVVDCIAIAGYDLRTSVLNAKPGDQYQPDEGVRGLEGRHLVEAFSEGTRKKIRHLLDVALVEGNDSLVLGAISCGAFAMERREDMMPVWVSEAFYDVLNEGQYRNKFRAIKFAVLSAGRSGPTNFQVFQSRFSPERSKM